MKKTAILWDIENVTPKTDESILSAFIENVSFDSQVIYSLAVADWVNGCIASKATILESNGFELVHLPKGKKNSADLALTAKGIELIFQVPAFERVILITGDADFSSLIKMLKKYGKEVRVVCDVRNNVSDELLQLVDDYLDYRDLIYPNADRCGLSEKQAYELFEETVSRLVDAGKVPALGTVKVQMKLLNASFNEKIYGCSTWGDFCRKAVSKTLIQFDPKQPSNLCVDGTKVIKKPEVFNVLLEAIHSRKNEWASFQSLGAVVPYKKYGYKKLKQMVLDAEKRGLVEVESKGLDWYCKSLG